jgi:hypothetical protein
MTHTGGNIQGDDIAGGEGAVIGNYRDPKAVPQNSLFSFNPQVITGGGVDDLLSLTRSAKPLSPAPFFTVHFADHATGNRDAIPGFPAVTVGAAERKTAEISESEVGNEVSMTRGHIGTEMVPPAETTCSFKPAARRVGYTAGL